MSWQFMNVLFDHNMYRSSETEQPRAFRGMKIGGVSRHYLLLIIHNLAGSVLLFFFLSNFVCTDTVSPLRSLAYKVSVVRYLGVLG